MAMVVSETFKGRIVGGVLGLADPVGAKATPPPFFRSSAETLFLATARAGILLLVRLLRPNTVWLPSYLCPSMIECLANWRGPIRFYPVDFDLQLRDTSWLAEVREKDLVCLVDYFGFHCPLDVKRAARKVEAWVLEDACQALLTEDIGECADFLLFSPRKFLGVPDGGILVSLKGTFFGEIELAEPKRRWWLKMLGATLLRRDFDQKGGDGADRRWFALFREAELEAPSEAFSMSSLTKNLIVEAFDYKYIAESRRANYMILAGLLEEYAIFPELYPGVVPLGFPIQFEGMQERDAIRKFLFSQGIYPPVHWPSHKLIPETFTQSRRLADTIMTVPCDQRYTGSEMERVASTVREAADRPLPDWAIQ